MQVGTGWDRRQGTWAAHGREAKRSDTKAWGWNYDSRMNDVVIQHPRFVRGAALMGAAIARTGRVLRVRVDGE
jgi:hypothetical protein